MKKFINFMKKHRLLMLFISALGIILDIFAFAPVNDFNILILTGVLVLAIVANEIEYQALVLASLSLIAVCPFLIIFKADLFGQKVAVWAYIFITLAICQRLLRVFKKSWREKKSI